MGRREKGLQLQQNENTGTKCLSQEKENQKVKDSMSNRQNIQDIRGWFKTEEKETRCVPQAKQYQKDKKCLIYIALWTLGVGSEKKTSEPSVFPKESKIRKYNFEC